MEKLVAKVRDGAKVTKKYDLPTTPHRRADWHKAVTQQDKVTMDDTLLGLNPAAIQRQIQALTGELLTPRPSPQPGPIPRFSPSPRAHP